MAVELYEPREEIALQAALWKGQMADLVGFKDFNDLVECVQHIDSTGLLILDLSGHEGEEEVKVAPLQGYIVRGVTGKFWVMTVQDFNKTYQAIPVAAKAVPDEHWSPEDRL